MAQGYAQAIPTRPNQLPQLPPAVVVFAKFPLGGLAPEKESRVVAPTRETDLRLKLLVEKWKNFHDYPYRISGIGSQLDANLLNQRITRYQHALAAVSDINCSAQDLRAFVAMLLELQGEENFRGKTGLLISALINSGPENRYVLQTEHFDFLISALGMFNEKEVLVYGDVGGNTGVLMQSGRITINGNAGACVGSNMRGGELIVTGDVDHKAGEYMKGGRLIVFGNADSGGVGWGMEDGEIHIHGRCGGLGYGIKGGKIFVGGRQIYPRLE